jgi:hypothetical protein
METIEKITIRCFVLGIVFVMIWFLFCVSGDWVYEIHSKWFELSKHEFAVIHYSGLMFAKVCVFLFFLLPYIACKSCGKE